MKRNVILYVGILMVLMAGCSKNEEIGKAEVIAWEDSVATLEAKESTEIESTLFVTEESTETESTVVVTLESTEDLSVILGKWTLDGEKTNEEMEKLGADLRAEFGTGIQYGAGAELRKDGYFSFYVGISVGGEGIYSYENGLVTVDYDLYVECVEKMELVLYPKVVDDKDYLILKMDGHELYLVRE